MLKAFTVIFFYFFLFAFIFSTQASQQILITQDELRSLGFSKYESVNPDSLIFPFKRLGEKTKSFFNFGEKSKVEYSYQLLDTRFKELVYIINYQKTGFLTEAVNRYNTLVGETKLNNSYTVDKNKVSKYLKTLETLRDRFPANSAHWLSIQQALDTTESL